MNSRFNYVASKLSDEELKDRLENRQKYLPETTEATVAELQQRGHVFSDEELNVINQDIKAQRDNVAIAPASSSALLNSAYKHNLVEDSDAPMLYSRNTIRIFTLLFSAFFGSIMLAININKTQNKIGIFWVLLFGAGFTAIQIAVGNYFSLGSSFSIICGFLAAICIDYFFWDRFIGNTTFYRAKPIWIPLIIALLFAAFAIWGTIYSVTHPS